MNCEARECQGRDSHMSQRTIADEKITDWIVELEMAAASLRGIAEAIQNGTLEGRQDQCNRTRDRLVTMREDLKRARSK